ncbi:Hexapeptide repeat of succinyl-transferase [Tessaracoccus oleiagri]|uniref:Hexapeptide repeat of succinyl-transferase n=2 Tax=Tessaracoccus oleiagri TaxID=686624 RepID=A0A1G9MU83_9ACTN|nr:Hexapeptide repeat of succinyl-transferase [Tessaracoccus oleiagri]
MTPWLERVLVRLYGIRRRSVRGVVTRLCLALEGGEMRSTTLREIFRNHHGVDVGLYTHGGCFVPFSFGRGTSIGRYSSIARTAFAATLDHPLERKSMHGFFFNPGLGYVSKEREYSPLRIGNDVWLGHNSIISAGVHEIGDGAVVGAGAVVFKDVPPYAVVVGNPGRVVRYRFSPETIERLLAERWWDTDVEDLKSRMHEFEAPFESGS